MPKSAKRAAEVVTRQIDAERRHEHRFLVNEGVARLVMRTTANNLPLARDDRPYQWSTTTYCDTPAWAVYRAGKSGAAMQLRLREYHRTRPRDVFGSGTLWIEFKDDDEETSLKERFGVTNALARSFLRGEHVLPEDERRLGERAQELLANGARPVVVTQYNRLAYSSLDSSLRVTADHNLMYMALPWTSRDTGEATALGPMLGMEPRVVIEMKWYGELPHWASDLHEYLKRESVSERPSKFMVAVGLLLGETDGEAT